MRLNDFRVGTRLSAGFAVVLCLLAIAVLVGAWRLQEAANQAQQLIAVPLTKERLAEEVFRNTSVALRRTMAIAKGVDPELEALFTEDAKRAAARGEEVYKSLEALLSSAEERRLLTELLATRKNYLAARDKVTLLRKQGQADEAAKLFNSDFMPLATTYIASLQKLLDMQKAQIDATGQAIAANAARGSLTLVVLGALALLAGGLLAWRLTRSVTVPVVEAARLADAVAHGDLTQRVTLSGSDELAQLMRSLDGMNANLLDIVGKVRQSADSIQVASSEVATGNFDLSQRTEETASHLQQAASSMAQLTGTLRQSADSAREADALAGSASEVAHRGGQVVAQVVSTMEEINAASKKIADIIGVIDGIAFQTNILALNAAVEAARAGEQGRGFAVVAGEVRSLAGRSAEAAREIKSLITASVDKVEAGSQLVNDAGRTMSEIVGSVQRVSDMIAAVTTATTQQSAGIQEVGGSVAHIDQMTQQNAALVEQSAAAAERMKEQGSALADLVGVFKLA